MSSYYYEKGIHFVKISVAEFKILMWDKKKKTTAIKNYANAGFFGGYKEGNLYFTMPVGNLMADIGTIGSVPLKYLKEWGKVKNGKCMLDTSKNGSPQFKDKAVSTLVVRTGSAYIKPLKTLPSDTLYAISGMPVIVDGEDVSYTNYVRPQGFKADIARPTKHIAVGIKRDGYIYLCGVTTKTSNCVSSSELYKMLKCYDFRDLILLDGGGSTVLDVGGVNRFVSNENRQINNVILF